MHLCLTIYFACMQSENVGDFFLMSFADLLGVMNELIETPWKCSSATSAVLGDLALILSDNLMWVTWMVVNELK